MCIFKKNIYIDLVKYSIFLFLFGVIYYNKTLHIYLERLF